MKFSRKSVLWGVLLIFGLTVGGAALRSDSFFEIKKNFTIFSEVFQEVTVRYVDDVNPQKLIRSGIDAMLETLDPYTVLIDEAENQNLEILTTGSYAGIGIEVGARGGRLVVVAPIEGYSAHNKGVRAGDFILEVDGIAVDNFSVDDMQSVISGEPGTTLVLTIERFGFDEPIDFELTREKIDIRNITYFGHLDDEKTIGYVSLARFGQNASVELREAIVQLKADGKVDGLILDLRNNPGGLLDEAVKVVDLFVGSGEEVVRTQGRGMESNFVARTESPVFFDKPLIVLQNNGSASSSEIVTGALQDYDRAVILGERSFGKGLVQVVRSLSYNTSLKITTSRYYIPSGRSIQSSQYNPENPNESVQLADSLRNMFMTQNGRKVYDGVGIDPDVEVSSEQLSLLEIALFRHSSFFFFANEYRSENSEFEGETISDSIFEEFTAFLQRSDFTYETRTQRNLNQLKSQMSEDDAAQLRDELERMESYLSEQKMKDMSENEDAIREHLFLELIARYDGEAARLKSSLSKDPSVGRALELFADEPQFKSVLLP
ncbi:MAG: S41 family peptidase [Balneolales bacterium]|nr:S41 family peptidase [Balneolales bacterium]